MQSIEQTGRTVEEAVKSALKILGVSREEVEVEVLSQESRGLLGILGYSEARVRVSVIAPAETLAPAAPSAPEEVTEEEEEQAPPPPPFTGEPSPLALRACELLGEILSLMHVTARPEITQEEEEAIYLTIKDKDEEDLGLLIGKRGQTLASLQMLVAMISNRPFPQEERKRIILDAADYRARRERSLISMAHAAADRAKRTGREVPLQALSPRERRIVHVTLADDKGVTTRSEGDDPERFVVVVPTRPREGGERGGGPRRGPRGQGRRRS